MENIFQILIGETDEISPPIERCMENVRSYSRGLEYQFFSANRMRTFIAEHYDPLVLRAYDKLKPYAYKADLGRYCLLYFFGGWYVDATVTLSIPLSSIKGVESVNHILFRTTSRPGQQITETQNALMYSRRGSAIFESAIIKIVENCRSEDLGVDFFDPTGPNVLGRAVASMGPVKNAIIGNYLPLTPFHPKKNYAFVLPDGTIIAMGKRTHGNKNDKGLELFGATGTNDYKLMYAENDIYNTDISLDGNMASLLLHSNDIRL